MELFQIVTVASQFKEELLLSTLNLFFQLPTCVSKHLMKDLIPFIQVSCHVVLNFQFKMIYLKRLTKLRNVLRGIQGININFSRSLAFQQTFILYFQQRACQDSSSLPSLATNLLDALERWEVCLRGETLQTLLPSLYHLLSYNNGFLFLFLICLIFSYFKTKIKFKVIRWSGNVFKF